MIDQDAISAVLQAGAHRREERRRFLRIAGGAAAMAGGMTLLSSCGDDDDGPAITLQPTPTGTPSPTAAAPPSEADVFNFALQLEYLESNFYLFATSGQGLPANLRTGTGTQGDAVGGRQANFTDPVVRQYARELAEDELLHVQFIRRTLGSAVAAQPAINIGGDANGAFTAAARSAGVVGATGVFDPYATDENFLLAAFLLAEVGVNAYMGGVQFLNTPAFIEAAAGIHAVEGYHSGLIRTALVTKGIQTPALNVFQNAQRISDARDTLDGTANTGLLNQGGDRDQGLGTPDNLNLVNADANAIAFVRSPSQVLNIAYLAAGPNIAGGGFFPNGVNGNIRSTTATG
ncbi:ferritin-like domain-containing protein [Sphingomonas lenta]|uniref:Ferritin-like domain-containing protein n=1 Tax=Sphingomonas lenta TaxID=1141887 RepID=A0A2A2SC68_9SPHN|nr:ferritin-like domain-containing protein [Sphingomonas lenta]PAX06856.1 hypothetical protein CKY28_12305 [Sphingomonas lenta]